MSHPKKLSGSDALDMRELYTSGDYTIRDLAEMYKIAPTTAWKIIRGFSYQSVTGGEPAELPGGKHTFKQEPLKGVDHPGHILSEDDVMAIRRKVAKDGIYGNKMMLYRALANKYGVSEITIASVATSASWRHLPSVAELRKKR